MRRWLIAGMMLPLLWAVASFPHAAAPPADDEERDRQAAERFRDMLERNPRRGAALDRLYGYHVEQGTLDKLVQRYQQRVARDARDGTSWMVLGLLEAQRGRDAAALAAFRQADSLRSNDALASYYLGQTLVLVGQPAAAVEAFERAIARGPASRNDLLDVFQALGRVHQRAYHHEQALAVWKRLEQLFPSDLRVLEQIAVTLAEEGQHEEALSRYEALVRRTGDQPERQAPFRLEAAELKVRLGRRPAALADFEELLGKLRPDSYYHRETRRLIEEVFRRNDDLAGLAKYYEAWIGRSPDDVEAMGRLARVLLHQGRTPEALSWLTKAIERDPQRKDLRLALIEQLVAEQKYTQAIDQYESLNKIDSNNPDYLREWGRLILRDTSRPEEQRKQTAAAIWRRLLTSRRKPDANAAVRVAELMRHANLIDEAIALYQQAIELTPNAPEYREYLGEYYHSLGRREDALATWRQNLAGEKRSAQSLGRLADVLAGFGYQKEATTALAEACALDKDDFALRMRFAELLNQEERYGDALRELEEANRLAGSPDDVEAVLVQQIKCYQATDKLAAQVEGLQKDLQAGKEPTAARWYRLARYREAAHQLSEATAALRQALARDDKSVLIWTAAARIHELAGDLRSAATANRRLADLDPKNRTDYLTNLAKLEARLGETEPALQAGRDVLAASPGNPDHYRFYADLCFQVGADEEGLETLRRGVRVNAADPEALMALAGALADRFRTDEAIELYWRALERTQALDDKLGLVARLADLYLQTNQFDRLLERLQRDRYEADKQRERALYLAQAYRSAGDSGTARQELERLLPDNPRDTQLLQQLVALAEAERDLGAAVQFQRQLVKVTPGLETEARLANLLARSGDAEEAGAIWVRLAQAEKDPLRVLQASDHLLAHGKHEAALTILRRLLREQPRNWEGLYREGAALAAAGKPADAAQRFQAILDLRLSDDEVSRLQAGTGSKKGGRAAPQAAGKNAKPRDFPLKDRLDVAPRLRLAAGLNVRDSYAASPVANFWSPGDFGQARMAALAWLLALSGKQNKQGDFLQQARAACDRAGQEPRAWWDWWYLQYVREDLRQTYEAAQVLSRRPDVDVRWLYLASLDSRTGARIVRQPSVQSPDEKDNQTPLAAADLEHMLSCYRSVQQQRPEWLLVHNALANVFAELKRAGRRAEQDQVYRDGVAVASQPEEIQVALQLVAERGDGDAFRRLLLKLAQPAQKSAVRTTYPDYPTSRVIMTTMDNRALVGAPGQIAPLLDGFLGALAQSHERAAPAAAGARIAPGQGLGNMMFYVGTFRKTYNLDYPPPNDYFNRDALGVMGNAYMLHDKSDLLGDLFAHLRAGIARTSGLEQLYKRLALAYLLWWRQDRDEAVRELHLAAEAFPQDVNLHIELAELLERNGQQHDALALVDSLSVVDHVMLMRREAAALRLAVRTGNVARARQAAERLFGLRLDADTQLQLAAQMSQLGMHQQAEAVLARARHQAGRRTNTLVSLMLQYQAQNKPDIAAQIAYQILRTAPALQQSPNVRTPDDYARDQSLQVLNRTGKLAEMIARAEGQLKNSPRSMQLHQALADYYQAAGDRVKSRQIHEAMARLRPDDARLRYQVAVELAQTGNAAAAVEHYTAAIKLDASLLMYDSWQVMQAFQQAGKLGELARALEEADLRSMSGRNWALTNILQQLLQNPAHREDGRRLFRKVWQALPQERINLLGSFYGGQVWQLPETYDYARQAVIPGENDRPPTPWEAFTQVYSSGSADGTSDGVIQRLLKAADEQNHLETLSREVEQALARRPDWVDGKVLLALLQLRRGQNDAPRQTVQQIVDDKKNPLPLNVAWTIGEELEKYSSLWPLAMRTYERGLEDRGQRSSFSNSPARRLVLLYEHAGRTPDARALIVKLAGAQQRVATYPHEFGAHFRELCSMAGELARLGYPLDALPMYHEVLRDPAVLESVRPSGYYEIPEQAEEGLARALRDMNPEKLARNLQLMLKSEKPAKESGPALDLLLMVPSRDLQKIRVTSLLESALRAASGLPRKLTEAQSLLEEFAARRPRDFPVHVAITLTALQRGTPGDGAAAVTRLLRLAQEFPLEELPPGVRATARQRAEAAQQIGLWLIARACLKEDALRADGTKLGERALLAAQRQTDQVYTLAILREWGQIALERGDQESAEKLWTQMLELVLPKAPTKQVERAAGAASGLSDIILVSQPPRAAAPPAAKSQTAATTEEFAQAAQIARLAAENHLPALALRAVRDTLRGGPPLAVRATTDQASVSLPVERTLAELETLWQREHVAAADIFDALVQVVLPEGRPAEIFLYPAPLSQGAGPRAWSVGRLLVQQAVRAGRTNELLERIAPRKDQPLAAEPARVLLAQLGVAAQNTALTRPALDWLDQQLQKQAPRNTAELACHAALPALPVDELRGPAVALLERAVKALSGLPGVEPGSGLHLLLAHLQFEQHNGAIGRGHLQEYLRAAPASGSRFGNEDYNLYQHKGRLARAAAEFVRAGQLSDALETLGKYADMARYWYGDPEVGGLAAALARQLATRPAAERYELLRSWTMPAANRKAVRLFAAFVPADMPPSVFGALPVAEPSGLVSSASLLIDAARAAGKLDELAVEVSTAAKQKVEHAQTLLLLVEIARGRGRALEASVARMPAEIAKKWQGAPQRSRADEWPDFLVFRACLSDDALGPAGRRGADFFLRPIRPGWDATFLTHLYHDRDARVATQAGNPGVAAHGNPSLKLWQPGDGRTAAAHAHGAAPARWVAHEGHLGHLGGTGEDLLYFAYPLTGDFEFSADAYEEGLAGGAVSYGGTAFGARQPMPDNRRVRYYPQQNMAPPIASTARVDAFNHLTIQVRAGKARWLVNSFQVHEEAELRPTSPWLALQAPGAERIVFRNVRLTGAPRIPREVPLSQADRLDHWSAGFYGETQASQVAARPDVPRSSGAQAGSGIWDYDWAARDGLIHGRRIQAFGQPEGTPSRLTYERPLHNGEAVQYEFYYEPELTLVHPALDRLAFVLEPGGVRLHWMTDGSEQDGTGLKTDNVADEPRNRRGPERLPLNPRAWNKFRLRLAGNSAVLELNGVTIFERAVEEENNRLFSLFHYKDRTAAKVRSVVLTGDWPREIDAAQFANLLPRAGTPPSVAERRACRELIGEQTFALSVSDVLQQSSLLPPVERYALLGDWVLPNDERPSFRLFGDFTSRDPPPVAGSPQSPPRETQTRVQMGGSLVAPALALVATATELNKLDELAATVRKSTQDARGQLALLALIQAAQQRDTEAADSLSRLLALSNKNPLDAPDWSEWPELLAAAGVRDRPMLHRAALALLDREAGRLRQRPPPSPFEVESWLFRPFPRSLFDKQVLHLQAIAQMTGLAEAKDALCGAEPRLAYWSRVSHRAAATRGAGFPPSGWCVRGDSLTQYHGQSNDALYFVVPLQGSFEVQAELTGPPHTMSLAYGGRWIGIQAERKTYTVYQDGREVRSGVIASPLTLGEWYDYRLVVRDDSWTAYVNGQKIHDEHRALGADPWLVVRPTGWGAGGVRNLRILGSPTVPQKLELSASSDLTGWLTYYEDSMVGGPASWQKHGDQIYGRALVDSPVRKQQSLLQYHRPLLEDGSVEYEFYFEPGKAMTHPALDRLVFLVDPDGVKIHWLTDAQHDRTGVAPDNITTEPANRHGTARLPLKERDWNRISLSLQGNNVSLKLNDTAIYERELEPGNQRLLGLFHYADETEARVRNVHYSGGWPQKLPAPRELMQSRPANQR